MPTYKKALIKLVLTALAGPIGLVMFLCSFSNPAFVGMSMFFLGVALCVYVGVTLYGRIADFKVEYYKRNGFDGVTKKKTLKTLKRNRRHWRNELMSASNLRERNSCFSNLVNTEAQIAEILGLPYEEPEELRRR